MRSALLAAVCCAAGGAAECPHLATRGSNPPPSWHPPAKGFEGLRKAAPQQLHGAAAVDWVALKQDILALIVTEQPSIYPFDHTGTYGGFLIRQSWHCSGSYRTMDGRGGCEGGRQRFNPELSWADNTQLDKAKRLLLPLKTKYGADLSWGDLMIFAGTSAMESMGAPVLGFCAGRVDDEDGSESTMLGPNAMQELVHPCHDPDNCTKDGFGTTNIGLIYVNPEGPGGNPDPVAESADVRVSFDHMSMNDTESVVLIGGGHSFGAAHGACAKGPGPSPIEDPADPWPLPGPCGTGNGVYTSGFEGSWSLTPTSWSNIFFKELVDFDWEVHVGPGGKHQWRVKNAGGNASVEALMMLTSDISLIHDRSYKALVRRFAHDQKAFDHQFAHAWYKLTTRDMGPIDRCRGPFIPPAQPFQAPLPPPPMNAPCADAVLKACQAAMRKPVAGVAMDRSSYAAAFVQLAYQSASTVRVTDYKGGANGARIRFAPEAGWKVNAGLDKVLRVLQPVKEAFGDGLAWADLITIAGTAGLTEFGFDAADLAFCGGRSDAVDGSGSEHLLPNGYGEDYNSTVRLFVDRIDVSGLPKWAFVALAGRPKSEALLHAIGYDGTYPAEFSGDYFNEILLNKWAKRETAGGAQFTAVGKEGLFATQTDVFLAYDPELRAIAGTYAADAALFKTRFAEAWTLLVNADRYDGPAGNLCY